MTNSSAATFYEIKENIEARSDQDIHSYVTSRDGGVDSILDLVFEQLPGAFLADKAGQRKIDFQYEINTPDGPRYYFADVHDGACYCGRGKLATPRVTMIMDIAVFLQVLTGTMAPVRAFLTRKIRVIGDMMAATKFESWFARP